jgi:hypothetical protein
VAARRDPLLDLLSGSHHIEFLANANLLPPWKLVNGVHEVVPAGYHCFTSFCWANPSYRHC